MPPLQVYLDLLADLLSTGLPNLRRVTYPQEWDGFFKVSGFERLVNRVESK